MYIDDERLAAEGLPGHITIVVSEEEGKSLLKGMSLNNVAEETGIGVTILCPEKMPDVIIAEVTESENESLKHMPQSEIQRVIRRVGAIATSRCR